MIDNLTKRELDVLSCISHGRSSKKIALLLNLSPRTIEWHKKNIMIKFNLSYKEELIDFVEKQLDLDWIKNRYFSIIYESRLEHSLKTLSGLVKSLNIEVSLVNKSNFSRDFINKIRNHLTYAGISICDVSTNRSNTKRIIYLVKQNDSIKFDHKTIDNTIILVISEYDEKDTNNVMGSKANKVLSLECNNYPESFLYFLKELDSRILIDDHLKNIKQLINMP